MTEQATIRIAGAYATEEGEYSAPFAVFIDRELVGEVNYGKIRCFMVAPGHHSVVVSQAGGMETRNYIVHVSADEMVTLKVASTLNIWIFAVFACLYIPFVVVLERMFDRTTTMLISYGAALLFLACTFCIRGAMCKLVQVDNSCYLNLGSQQVRQ